MQVRGSGLIANRQALGHTPALPPALAGLAAQSGSPCAQPTLFPRPGQPPHPAQVTHWLCSARRAAGGSGHCQGSASTRREPEPSVGLSAAAPLPCQDLTHFRSRLPSSICGMRRTRVLRPSSSAHPSPPPKPCVYLGDLGQCAKGWEPTDLKAKAAGSPPVSASEEHFGHAICRTRPAQSLSPAQITGTESKHSRPRLSQPRDQSRPTERWADMG